MSKKEVVMYGAGAEAVGAQEVSEVENPDGSASGGLVFLSAAGGFLSFVSEHIFLVGVSLGEVFS